jgi:hypothetical protein
MRAARCIGLTSASLVTFAFTACSTLKVAADVDVDGKYPLSFSDVREIERLLPGLGVSRPISRIYMDGPDRASVSCDLRIPPGEFLPEETISFTVVRRQGRWIPVDKPSVGRIMFTG